MRHMTIRDTKGTVLAEGDGDEFRPTAERLYHSIAPRANRNKVLVIKQHFPGGNTYHCQFSTRGGHSLDDLVVVRWTESG